jgi:hypothetical protein
MNFSIEKTIKKIPDLIYEKRELVIGLLCLVVICCFVAVIIGCFINIIR